VNPPGDPLRGLPARAAREAPDRTAMIVSGARVTFAELASRVAALASKLKTAGVGPGMQVALPWPNSPEYVVWYFAVLETGGVIVPLPADLRPAEAGERLAAGAILFLAAPAPAAWPAGIGLGPAAGLEAAEGGRLWRREGTAPQREDDGVLTRQFSSGSTGRPKQMLKTEVNVAHDAWHFASTLGLGADDVFLGVAPFSHAYGALNFLAALESRGALVVLPRFLPGAVLQAARRNAPTVFLATPPMIRILGACALEPGDETAFGRLRYCICSTDRLDAAAHDAFLRRYGRPVRVQYGSTETLSATVDLDDGFEEGRVGRPFEGVDVGVYDDQGNPCPAGQRGRVGIRSPAASDRYVDDPESTARTFRDGRVFPGDEGWLDARGRLHILGRSDVINIGGYKVDALEVERAIRDALPVRAVIVAAGERNGLPVVRAIVEADPAEVTPLKVQDACRGRLSPYKVPALVDVLAALPRDGSGKVRRAPLGLES
jgi:acyl-CoA synthetase (AMP-forming)/AMP-acid ligase II